MVVDIYKILLIYEKEISKSVKNKKKLYHFERNKMLNINNIYNILTCYDNYEIKYNIFKIYEPKERIILSLNISDKIINHYFTRYCLDLKLNKFFDFRNVATRKKLGTSWGRKLLNKYLELYKKFDFFYILKIDIKGYFYNIDHNVLKTMLYNILDPYEFKLLCLILDSTNRDYIFKKCNHYGNNKGLPIGSMTSQILAIFYLSKLDKMIINDFGFKHMVRYMDDYIIISNNKNELKLLLNKIVLILNEEFKLEINKNKTFIVRSDTGFNFLGFHYKIKNKKTIITISNSSKKRIRKNLSKKRSLISYVSMINCYKYSYKINRSLIRRYISNNYINLDNNKDVNLNTIFIDL